MTGTFPPDNLDNSDARSGQVVEDRIRPALESGAAVGSKRPVLLVVDEIDGATGGGDNVWLPSYILLVHFHTTFISL